LEFLDVFKQSYLVIGLPDEAIQEIYALGTYRVHEPQADLIRAGEPSGDLIAILDGRVNVLTPTGEKITELGPGHVLGEISLIDNQPRSAHAVCIGRVQACHIPSGDLRKLMGAKRDIGFVVLTNLARMMAMRLRNTGLRLDNLSDQLHKQNPWKNAI
jgi:CRP/FNR family transcriptional regulator, cyclic AMP receptor protein